LARSAVRGGVTSLLGSFSASVVALEVESDLLELVCLLRAILVAGAVGWEAFTLT
jgi:hypothetical protein